MRNRMNHGYDDVDMDIIWDAVDQRIPRLILQIERLIPRHRSNGDEELSTRLAVLLKTRNATGTTTGIRPG